MTKFICFDSIDSTNTEAKKMCLENPEISDTALIALEQTAGRGRLERKFYSPKGSGIYFSYIFSDEHGISDPAKYTIAAGVSVCNIMEETFRNSKIECKIKWVNDIFSNGKKCGGILTEGIVSDGSIKKIVTGIGINFTSEGIPENVKNVAGGILDNADSPQVSNEEKIKIAERIVLKMKSLFDDFDGKWAEIIEDYRNRSLLKGRKVTINKVAGIDQNAATGENCFEAEVLDIDENGNLVVKTQDGKELHLFSGEVSIGSNKIQQEPLPVAAQCRS